MRPLKMVDFPANRYRLTNHKSMEHRRKLDNIPFANNNRIWNYTSFFKVHVK